jgi:hypothetical protein
MADKRRMKIDELESELLEWAEGRRSHVNVVWTAFGPDRRGEAMVACAQMDAAEVAKLSAAIQALVSVAAHDDRRA